MAMETVDQIRIAPSLQVTHNVFPVTPLTISETVLKGSDDLDIFGVTFDSKMTFEKHLRSVSRAAYLEAVLTSIPY